ncbi:cobyrinate a,c-diamide synthase [Robbsia andropogonis]|uniref:cobyrinate a,c-diamide synthase n=1 Tax=Robbsia andropogonis TaxID=28092 RepID=UPI000463DB0C|nr:cobyrinate a,c-diamide synthase [Robbsia andropogonis]
MGTSSPRQPGAASCPALFIGAPASNQGKTTVTAALARWHTRQGRRVRVFKTGPDFLDPMILARASGAPVWSLHLWMVGEEACRTILADAAREADLILIEGVMGLFDGQPSGADLAERFGVPVLAVIDAQAMAHTFGALAFGLARYRPTLSFHGVLANRVATLTHAASLKASLSDDIHWCGHLPPDAAITLPDRHLGLTQAQEIADLDSRLDAAADGLAQALTQLGVAHAGQQADGGANTPPVVNSATPGDDHAARDRAMCAILPTAAIFRDPVTDSGGTVASRAASDHVGRTLHNDASHHPLAGKCIAIARDPAFSFLYPANLALLLALGARIATFSPIADEPVPADADALVLPGGYPELHAAALARARRTAASIRAHVAARLPTLAECGGMLYLMDGLTDIEGQRWPMLGALPGESIMQPKLAALGMHLLETPQGEVRGHTFHYSRSTTSLAPSSVTRHATRHTPGEAVYRHQAITATYFHAYWPSNPKWLVATLTDPTL